MTHDSQGRGIVTRDSRIQARRYFGRGLRILRAGVPAADEDAPGLDRALPFGHRLLLLHEETTRRHAIPQSGQKGFPGYRSSGRGSTSVQQTRLVSVYPQSETVTTDPEHRPLSHCSEAPTQHVVEPP